MKLLPLSGGFRLILGIASGIIGILKLLSPMHGLPILGDLLPALAGITVGFILIFGFYRDHSASVDKEGALDQIGEILLHNKKIAGIVLLAVSMLHFLFPTAWLL